MAKAALESVTEREDARRWVSNCLLHLADVSLELRDLDTARRCLDEEEEAIKSAYHITEPVAK